MAFVGGALYGGPGALGPEGDTWGIFSNKPPVRMVPGGPAPVGFVGVPLRSIEARRGGE